MSSFTGKQVKSVKNIYTNVDYSVLNLNPPSTIECQKPLSVFLLFSVSFSLLSGVLQRNGLYSSFLYVPPAADGANHVILVADIYTFAE